MSDTEEGSGTVFELELTGGRAPVEPVAAANVAEIVREEVGEG